MNREELIEDLELSLDMYFGLKQWTNTHTIKIRGKEISIEEIDIDTLTNEEIVEITRFLDANIKYNLPDVVGNSIVKNLGIKVS